MLHPISPLRSIAFVSLLLVFVLGIPSLMFTQRQWVGAPAAAAAAPNRQPSTQILLTGKLLGYLRMPEDQSAVTPPEQQVCPVSSVQNSNSQNFLDAVDLQRKGTPNTVLVGMGDNFSPELFARVFRPAPSAEFYSKDLYAWDWMQTHPLSLAPDPKDRQGVWCLTNEITPAVRAALDAGRGFIPVDNVGCFLAAAHYDAIVPGKHDFYFGPERLRHLARFLATPETNRHYAVQMLATNLVIRTDYLQRPKMLSDAERGVVQHYVTNDDHLKPKNISDGQHVLPWMQRFEFTPDQDFPNLEAYLCTAKPGDPTASTMDVRACPGMPPEPFPLGAQPPSLRAFRVPHQLLPSESYLLCLVRPSAPNYCVRFTVDFPFFLYPNMHPTKIGQGHTYTDPLPYSMEMPQCFNGPAGLSRASRRWRLPSWLQ